MIKVFDEEPNDYCDFCNEVMVNAEFIATDRPPPDKEFIGLVDPYDWKPTESIEEAYRRVNDRKKKQKPTHEDKIRYALLKDGKRFLEL